MLKWLGIIVRTLWSVLHSHRALTTESLMLRQQLAVLKHRHPRPRLTDAARLFWVVLSSIWSGWREVLHIVQPETVVRWHRQGFRYYWRWKSRHRGRPRLDPHVRELIRRMCRANPLWGAPRIHGELLKLGIEVSEATVSRYMIKRRGPPSQTWRTYLDNRGKDIIALDFFTVPTAAWTARQLQEACGLDETPRYLLRDRDAIYGEDFHRQAAALRIKEVTTTPRSPWQNPYAERMIGSISNASCRATSTITTMQERICHW